MDKPNVGSAYTGILFINKKKQTTDTGYGMDEFQKPYAYSKKPDAEDYELYDSVYTKCPEKAALQRHKVD